MDQPMIKAVVIRRDDQNMSQNVLQLEKREDLSRTFWSKETQR